jgi:hypothetical protein
MMRVWLVLLLTLFARDLTAQATIVRPPAPLDSARATLRDAVLVLRDSLNSIDAAAARLQRDNRAASGAALSSRARIMRDACARSFRTVPATKVVVASADASSEVRVKHQRKLLRALDQLGQGLSRCETEFAAMSKPGAAEEVRGYGNHRAARVQAELRKYAQAASGFLSVMGIKVTPLGAGPNPLAG